LFVRSGSWLSLDQLENNLTLNELFLLYRAAQNIVSVEMKIAAAAQGADVNFEEDWYDPPPKRAIQPLDIAQMGIGLGYESRP
jgi:glucose-6-phosphate isomerase